MGGVFSFYDLFLSSMGAFVGGVLLNLMPCVFPILSLKVLSFMHLDKRTSFRNRLFEPLCYWGGIAFSMLILAITLILLQNAGQHVGWGYQMQNPTFIAVMVCILFLMGLLLSGFYDIPAIFLSASSKINNGSRWSAFFTGILSTFVATPCSAPFMASAVGFALISGGSVDIIVVLQFLGFGVAMPYLMVALIPGLAHLLPRPGRWMDLLKQFLAFPMYASGIWLLWVFGNQVGIAGTIVLVSELLCLVFIIWLWGVIPRRMYFIRLICALLGLSTILFTFTSIVFSDVGLPKVAEVFSQKEIEQQLNAGKMVFVAIGADWCITCHMNEFFIESKEIKSLFKMKGVVYMKGDWTNNDPVITQYLRSFNRNSVPFYVLYKKNTNPIVLPQLLTKDTIKQYLK